MAFTLAALGACSSLAHAQLRADEVVVIYDSRIPDSLAVAEYYAGSAAVPGGQGSLHGARAGVRALDLASTGAPVTGPGDVSYTNFVSRLRDPIRNWLTANGLAQRIRCLVTTKGLPHRVQDSDFPTAGDNPTNLVNEYLANDATCASVDTELTLLWQDLTTGENGGANDSKSDGAVQNPFWKSLTTIGTTSQANNQVQKSYTLNASGPTWVPFGAVGAATRLSPGDLYLVSRLDADTVAVVRDAIDRAADIMYDTVNHSIMLDESASNGLADAAANSELDNSNGAFPALRDGDDYELTRNETQADLRFGAAYVQYNALSGGDQFFVGPRVTWFPGDGLPLNRTLDLVATYGANHSGVPRATDGVPRRTNYADGYLYTNGSIINSVESYNARDFGGLGQLEFATQQQIAGFLAAGGTFGVGNVWEPLADTVPDNRYLVANFIRGNLSWAEAAWSAIPGLSWQQLAVGDPLARSHRSSEDINADGRSTIDDLYAWEASPSDVNHSGAADSTDRALVLTALRAWERADLLTGQQSR